MPEGITPSPFFEAWRAALLSKDYSLSILQDGKHICFFGFINDAGMITYTEPETQKFRLIWLEGTSELNITAPGKAAVVKRGAPEGNHWQLNYEVVDNQVVDFSIRSMTGDGFRLGNVQGTGRLKMGD